MHTVQEFRDLRDIILALTALGAALSFLINVFNSFFIELMKLRYKNSPGKQSVFETIMNLVAYLSVIFSIVIYGFIIFDIFKNGISSEFIPKKLEFNAESSIEILFTTLCVISLLIMIIVITYYPMIIYSKIREVFIENLEHGKTVQITKKMKNLMNVVLIINAILIILWLFFRISVQDKQYTLQVFDYFAITSLVSFITLLSYKEILKNNNDEKQYCMYINSKAIVCKSFLEYTDYYLVFINGVETYIKKTFVEKIEKKIIIIR